MLVWFHSSIPGPELRVKRMIHFPFLAFLFNFLLFPVLELFLFPRIEETDRQACKMSFQGLMGVLEILRWFISPTNEISESGHGWHFTGGVGLGFLFAFRPTAASVNYEHSTNSRGQISFECLGLGIVDSNQGSLFAFRHFVGVGFG